MHPLRAGHREGRVAGAHLDDADADMRAADQALAAEVRQSLLLLGGSLATTASMVAVVIVLLALLT